MTLYYLGADTRMDKFYKLVNKNFRSNSSNKIKNGIISLKGGIYMKS